MSERASALSLWMGKGMSERALALSLWMGNGAYRPVPNGKGKREKRNRGKRGTGEKEEKE